MFGVIVLKSTNPTQPTFFDKKATLEPNVYQISSIIEFLPKIESNPQPMSYFRQLKRRSVVKRASMAIEFIKLCNPILLVTCSRRDKCLFNFQHHWNAVHRVRPRSSELCNWMPYSVGLLHIVCTPYIYIHTYI